MALVYLDGTSRIDANTALRTTGVSWACSFWYKPLWPTLNMGAATVAIRNAKDGTNYGDCLINAAGTVSARWRKTATWSATTANAVLLNAWNHIVFGVTSTRRWVMLNGGTMATEVSGPHSIGGTFVDTYINGGSSTNPGKIAEVVFFNSTGENTLYNDSSLCAYLANGAPVESVSDLFDTVLQCLPLYDSYTVSRGGNKSDIKWSMTRSTAVAPPRFDNDYPPVHRQRSPKYYIPPFKAPAASTSVPVFMHHYKQMMVA